LGPFKPLKQRFFIFYFFRIVMRFKPKMNLTPFYAGCLNSKLALWFFPYFLRIVLRFFPSLCSKFKIQALLWFFPGICSIRYRFNSEQKSHKQLWQSIVTPWQNTVIKTLIITLPFWILLRCWTITIYKATKHIRNNKGQERLIKQPNIFSIILWHIKKVYSL